MKNKTLHHPLFKVFVASVALSLPIFASADTLNTWKFDNINTSNKYTIEPHFFYVGKGSEWQNIRFISDYSTEHFTTLLVKLDDKLIYNTTEPYRVCRRLNILRDYSDEKTKLYPRN
ncbi:hypothetical protein F895_03196 [Acinetobacter sp. CIP 64.2]|nr:hypothetical protein F895_03196 [Acinetobacter sp. CIP 64.2]